MTSTPPDLASSEPRDHHYLFAHRFMRDVCQDDPLRFFALMGSPEQRPFLDWLWESCGKALDSADAVLPSQGLSVSTGRLLDFPTIVVTPPPAQGMAEAHLVAIVLVGPEGAPTDTPEARAAMFRYFTLELGMRTDGSARTVLCEWTSEAHRNFGDGPPAEEGAFVSAVEKLLRGAATKT